MDSERRKRIDSLLQLALQRPPGDHDAFLRQACGGDEELELEVRSLLASRQSISHYQVLEKLGAGGMGVVWKARDSRLNRFVALKVLPAARMTDSERKRRFAQEARTASALNHPNIITIYDIDQADGEDFIAMEFVPGKALDRLIPRKGLRLKEALEYAIQVADALAAAHAAGIVHRDLKPGNVMVSENGCVKVLDFGLAKLIDRSGSGEFAPTETIAEQPKTSDGTIVGTVSYMSPEQAEGKSVDARTDIFSFGAVLYEMITGRRAFAGDSIVSILSAILHGEPKPAAEIIDGVPRGLDKIVTRCLQKDPNRRYQHAGDLRIDLQEVKEALIGGGSVLHEEMRRRRSARRWRWTAAAAACVAVSLAVAWWLHRPEEEPASWTLTQLTRDAGLSNSPALSPDGKLVAYSSDRGLDGEQDLYMKQVAGGQPIRLTFGGAGNTMPDFSPDGSKIVFRSNRDGGGIYEIPAFGGEARLLARDGLNPKYSPDGSQVAYWVGSEIVIPALPGSGTVWVVPVSGGQPQRVGSNFTTARNPIWSPDGKHLLMIGYTSTKAYEASSLDWWLVGSNGGDAVKTGFYDKLVHSKDRMPFPQNLTVPRPGCWLAAGNEIVYSLASGDTANLWEVGISPRTGKVSGMPKRLTTAAGNEQDPSCAPGGALTFTSLEIRTDVWSLPFDPGRGTSTGALERITAGPAWREGASFTNNGRYVAFASNQSGPTNIWVRNLATGKELTAAASSFQQRYPLSNASGSRIAFSAFERDKRVVYVSAPGGVPEKLCEGCVRATDWSHNEKALLVFSGDPYQINVLDLASHQQIALLKHPTYHLLYGRFSPDNRWISFTARIQPNRGRIAIAPLDGPKPVPESAWITIAEGGPGVWADWSPDGKVLYFTSERDGHTCLWGQRIEAGSHRPVGEPFAVQHFHGRVSYKQLGSWWRVSGGRIAMVLSENTGNIWMMSRSGTR